MDAARERVLESLLEVMERSRRAGVLYLAPDGRRADSHRSWPWPADEAGRADVLPLVVAELGRVTGAWRVTYCEEGVPLRRGYSDLWPDREGLFGPEPAPARPAPDPAGRAAPAAEGDCAEDVLYLFRYQGRRMTAEEVHRECVERAMGWSEAAVRRELAALHRDGRLGHRKQPDARGAGYGLPGWGAED